MITLSLMTIIFLIKQSSLTEFKEPLGSQKWIAKVDKQIKMDEEGIPLTAFSAPQGHYEWIVMPFGLRNALQIFQTRMGNIFKDLNHCCLVYIDDIPVFLRLLNNTHMMY